MWPRLCSLWDSFSDELKSSTDLLIVIERWGLTKISFPPEFWALEKKKDFFIIWSSGKRKMVLFWENFDSKEWDLLFEVVRLSSSFRGCSKRFWWFFVHTIFWRVFNPFFSFRFFWNLWLNFLFSLRSTFTSFKHYQNFFLQTKNSLKKLSKKTIFSQK